MYLRIDAYQLEFIWRVRITLDPYRTGESPSVLPVIQDLELASPDYDPSDAKDVMREIVRSLAEYL